MKSFPFTSSFRFLGVRVGANNMAVHVGDWRNAHVELVESSHNECDGSKDNLIVQIKIFLVAIKVKRYKLSKAKHTKKTTNIFAILFHITNHESFIDIA